MKSTYQHIFSPLNVKNMAIKNRIVMVPMGTKDHRWSFPMLLFLMMLRF